MTETRRTYVPAAGRDWGLPLYDPIVKLLGADRTRQALIDLAALQPGHRVLEIGCGTGTVIIRLKRTHPDVTVVGLDPDPKALARAQKKARRAGVSIQLDQGFADSLPYADGSFDRVLSSFMFHHLPASEQEPTLQAVRRVLTPEGRLILVDFVGHQHHFKGNTDDRILALMRQAGFENPRRIRQDTLLFGHVRVHYYEAGLNQS